MQNKTTQFQNGTQTISPELADIIDPQINPVEAVSYASQLLMTAYCQAAGLYSLKDNDTEIAKYFKLAAFEVLANTLSAFMAEIGADEDIVTRQLAQLCKELDITDENYIAWITEKWAFAMTMFMDSDQE